MRCDSLDFEITPETYAAARRELLDANANLSGVVLREDERALDELLCRLKREYRETFGGKVDYKMPVLTDKRIASSPLYAFLSAMPKGADLHVHDMSLLPAKDLIPLLATCPAFCVRVGGGYDLLTVAEGEAVPEGYLRFSEALTSGAVTADDLLTNWTVAGADASPLGIWDYFEELFCRQGCLSSNPAFAAVYYDYTFRYYARHGISHVEIHLMLTDSIDESADYVRVIREAYYAVRRDFPSFTVRIIGAGVKDDNDKIEMTKKCFLNTSYVQEIVKDETDPENVTDFVIGFDLVNEEDASLPLSAFAPMLLKAKKQFPAMKLYVHGGESLDAGNENLIDAYLLGAERVGHGLNLYRFPDLHARYAKREICLEVCPISNEVLGYARDLRNHPAVEYLRTGVPIALCSDDPAYMENETLTDDFLAATVAWDLSLSDLKQLAINSIMYSGLDKKTKFSSLHAYNEAWRAFVEGTLSALGGKE